MNEIPSLQRLSAVGEKGSRYCIRLSEKNGSIKKKKQKIMNYFDSGCIGSNSSISNKRTVYTEERKIRADNISQHFKNNG